MLRGMDNFAQGGEEFEEGITINCNKKNHSNPKKVQSPRRKSPQDRESFTYEHFPVVCPTCRGTGKVRAGMNLRVVGHRTPDFIAPEIFRLDRQSYFCNAHFDTMFGCFYF